MRRSHFQRFPTKFNSVWIIRFISADKISKFACKGKVQDGNGHVWEQPRSKTPAHNECDSYYLYYWMSALMNAQASKCRKLFFSPSLCARDEMNITVFGSSNSPSFRSADFKHRHRKFYGDGRVVPQQHSKDFRCNNFLATCLCRVRMRNNQSVCRSRLC